MKLLAVDLLFHGPEPDTGRVADPHERIAEALRGAVWAEQAGFDAVGIGERHAAPFLSSAPTVLRVAEDFATIDSLSGGRVELERFLDRVAPVLRADLPSRVWPDTELTA